jgi:hypothetical protein
VNCRPAMKRCRHERGTPPRGAAELWQGVRALRSSAAQLHQTSRLAELSDALREAVDAG